MKILMIAPQPFFEPRGTPISVYQRLEALSTLGHKVDLITYHVGKDVSFPNVRIYRAPKIWFIKHVRVGPSRAKILLDFLIILKVIQMLVFYRYDVVHTHEEAAFFCMPLAYLFRTRHIYDMHSVLSKQLVNFNHGNRRIFIRLFELLENWVIKHSDAVITIGADLEEYVRSVIPDGKIYRIENIALHAYQTPVTEEAVDILRKTLNLNGRLPIVYTGTYERYQGLGMVLEAIKIVRKEFPDAIFIFVGAKNTQAGDWTELAGEMELSDHTLFLDVVSPEESMVYLAYADVLISPRVSGTSTPLKIYSYLHSGKPIVATNIPAHTQVLNPDIAVLVEPNVDAFAEGIIKILQDPEHGKQMGSNAHLFALEHYNYQKYIAKVNQTYQDLAAGAESETPVYEIRNK